MNPYSHFRYFSSSRPSGKIDVVLRVNRIVELDEGHISGSVTGPQNSPAVEITERPIPIFTILNTPRCSAGAVLMVPVNHHAGCIRGSYSTMISSNEVWAPITTRIIDRAT